MSDNNPSVVDPFGPIADEFVEAFRHGLRPSVEEFARRYPEHADEIREILCGGLQAVKTIWFGIALRFDSLRRLQS